jgi:hypothetical protein
VSRRRIAEMVARELDKWVETGTASEEEAGRRVRKRPAAAAGVQKRPAARAIRGRPAAAA